MKDTNDAVFEANIISKFPNTALAKDFRRRNKMATLFQPSSRGHHTTFQQDEFDRGSDSLFVDKFSSSACRTPLMNTFATQDHSQLSKKNSPRSPQQVIKHKELKDLQLQLDKHDICMLHDKLENFVSITDSHLMTQKVQDLFNQRDKFHQGFIEKVQDLAMLKEDVPQALQVLLLQHLNSQRKDMAKIVQFLQIAMSTKDNELQMLKTRLAKVTRDLNQMKNREKEQERYKEDLFAGVKGHKYEEIS